MTNTFRRNTFMTFILSVALVFLSACGAANTPSSANGQGSAETAKPAQANSALPSAQTSAAPKEVKPITIAEPNRVLAFAPVYVAISKGFFEKNGLKVNLVSGGGGTQTLAALLSGSAQFTAATPITFFTLLEKNQDMLAVSSFNKGLPFQTILSNQYIEKKGLKADAPMKDKVAALKGATFGAITLGSAQELYLKAQLQLGGLKPDDVKVTVIGDMGALMTALKEGIIDGTISSPPVAQQAEARNIGKTWLNGSDFKEFDGMDSQWLFGTRKWIEQNPDMTKAAVKALGEGIAFVRDQPAESAKALQPFFEGVDVKILEKSVTDIKFAFEGNGSMTVESWQKSLKPLTDLSSVSKITKQFDLKEEGFWTNKYISK